MPSRPDGRKYRRRQALGKVSLSWQTPNGIVRNVVGKCLDISETGLRAEVSTAIETRTLVKLQAEQYKLLGVATVRYCERKKVNFVVGLEFVGGMEWRGGPEPASPPVA